MSAQCLFLVCNSNMLVNLDQCMDLLELGRRECSLWLDSVFCIMLYHLGAVLIWPYFIKKEIHTTWPQQRCILKHNMDEQYFLWLSGTDAKKPIPLCLDLERKKNIDYLFLDRIFPKVPLIQNRKLCTQKGISSNF